MCVEERERKGGREGVCECVCVYTWRRDTVCSRGPCSWTGIFPSSKTVITGAVNWAEVDDAYDFASRLLLQNFEEVRKPVDGGGASRRGRVRDK